MTVKAGVTEIPDSEDELMTSSPAYDPSDKLLTTPHHLFQAQQGAPGEAQASATTGASAVGESLVDNAEIYVPYFDGSTTRTPTDTQPINENPQSQPCPENAFTLDHSPPNSISTQTGSSPNQSEPDDPVYGKSTNDQYIVEDVNGRAVDVQESLPPPQQDMPSTMLVAEQREHDQQQSTEEKTAHQKFDNTELCTATHRASRGVAYEGAISTEKDLQTSLSAAEKSQDGIHVIDFAYFVPEAMPRETCNKQNAAASAPEEERNTSLSPEPTPTVESTPPELGQIDRDDPESTPSYGGFILGSFSPKEHLISGGPPSGNTAPKMAAPPGSSTDDEETITKDTGSEIRNIKSHKQENHLLQMHTTLGERAQDPSSAEKAAPNEISATTPKPKGKTSPTPAKSAQETTLAGLKAQRSALVAALAALPNIQEIIEQDVASSELDETYESGPTDEQVMAAANKIVKKHIKLLHEYNEIKDAGQGLMGLIADQRGVRIVEVQDEFGIREKD